MYINGAEYYWCILMLDSNDSMVSSTDDTVYDDVMNIF